jgi:Zn-dependent peptidase ImmA (M78 family)
MLDNTHRSIDELADAVPVLEPQLRDGLAELIVDLEVLEKAARYFKRPWSYLLIDIPEVLPAIGRDHRRRHGPATELSTHLLEALRASEEQLETVVDLFPDDVLLPTGLDMSLPSPELVGDRAESVGSSVRAWLAVSTISQLNLHDDFEGLRLWIEAAGARGVYVAQRKLDDTSVRAFSLMRDEHALAVLDTGESGQARTFSLLHELMHLLMRGAGLCDMDESTAIERWCNAVAASTLLPASLITSADLGPLRSDDRERADEGLRALATGLGVSQQALLIRCRQLGALTDDEYFALDARRRARRASARAQGGGNYYLNAVNLVGRRYTRRVLGALDDAQISSAEASSALGVGEYRLGGLRKWL